MLLLMVLLRLVLDLLLLRPIQRHSVVLLELQVLTQQLLVIVRMRLVITLQQSVSKLQQHLTVQPLLVIKPKQQQITRLFWVQQLKRLQRQALHLLCRCHVKLVLLRL